MKKLHLMVILWLLVTAAAAALGQQASPAPAGAPAKAGEASEAPPGPAELELIALEKEWMDAIVRRDQATLDRIMAADFTVARFMDWDHLEPKAGMVKAMTRFMKIESYKLDKTRVRLFGDTAIVNTALTQKASFGDRDYSGTFTLLDVWIKRAGRWQVVARHVKWDHEP